MSSSIEFRLFAPSIDEVFPLSSFDDWKEISMCKDLITGEFSTTVDLDDSEYTYKFLEDDNQGGIVKISQGKNVNGNEYFWKYDGKYLPENSDLIIYEIFLTDFTAEGIDCIELMPIQAFLLGHNWGYTTRHFFAVEPSYGTSEDFVFNHSHIECPLNKIDSTYWYYKDVHHPEHAEETWVPEFNYDYEDKQHGGIKSALKFIGDVIRFWIEEYHIDGMRFDAAKQIDNHEVLRHFDSIGHFLRELFYTVAEFVPASPEIVKPQEWGEDQILGNENRTKKINKLDWSALSKSSQQSLFNLHQRLIAFRKTSLALKSNNIDFFHCHFEEHFIAYHRWSDEINDLVVVVLNFSTKDQQNYCILDWRKNGLWYELISQTEIEIEQNELQINLKSYESKIFVWKI
ncbi:hypothetical protein I4U23_010414 [Adineta vaga]|nr:hypothetical protein I4U23_010414 [Adineta vaga]